MPMWAQTYKSGKPFYREHKASRSHGLCTGGGSILCKTLDDQLSRLIEAIELGPHWLEEVLSIISLKDEVAQVKKARQVVQEKLRRMGKAYIDGVFPDEEYHRQKKLLEMELESLVVPAADAAAPFVTGNRNQFLETCYTEQLNWLPTHQTAVTIK